MKKHLRAPGVLCLLVASSAALAQPLVMDAAIPNENQRVEPATYRLVVVTNALPNPDVQYQIDANVATEQVGFPDLKEELARIGGGFFRGQKGPRVAQQCADLRAAADALLSAKEEKDVPKLLLDLNLHLNESPPPECSESFELAQVLVKLTRREFTTHLPIDPGMVATVVLHRAWAGENPTVVATKKFSTGTFGSIRASAFTGFVTNNDHRWFAKAAEEGDGFIVTRERDRDSADFVLALLLSWEPTYDTTKNGFSELVAFKRGAVTGSWVVGLGAQSEDPMVLAGYRLGLGQHLGFAVGYGGYNQSRLKGIYAGDGSDRIKDALTPEQLMEDTYSGGWWLGITLKP